MAFATLGERTRLESWVVPNTTRAIPTSEWGRGRGGLGKGKSINPVGGVIVSELIYAYTVVVVSVQQPDLAWRIFVFVGEHHIDTRVFRHNLPVCTVLQCTAVEERRLAASLTNEVLDQLRVTAARAAPCA